MYFFFVIHPATTEISTHRHTVPLPDALPLCPTVQVEDAQERAGLGRSWLGRRRAVERREYLVGLAQFQPLQEASVATRQPPPHMLVPIDVKVLRSEEHTSELQ